MDAYLDHLLDELVTVEPHEAWQDVLHRARRSRRRYAAALVLVVALCLAPAAWAIAQAFEGKPAPPSVRFSFGHTIVGAHSLKELLALAEREPEAVVSKAHGVIQLHTKYGRIDLWAAPARSGGKCFLIAWQERGYPPIDVGCYPATPPTVGGPFVHNLIWTSRDYDRLYYLHRTYNLVNGRAYGGATSLRVTLSNHKTKTFPVVEGLFLGVWKQSLPSRQRPKIVALTTYDERGHVVGYWKRVR
jgi:hypothetical protein